MKRCFKKRMNSNFPSSTTISNNLMASLIKRTVFSLLEIMDFETLSPKQSCYLPELYFLDIN